MRKAIDPEKDLPSARAPLNQLSKELLKLHKLLLDLTREEYERANGRIENSFKVLELVLNDPSFAWLRKLSELIVLIDEIVEREITSDDVESVSREVRAMLFEPESSADFNQRFQPLLKKEVNVLLQQNVVNAALNALK